MYSALKLSTTIFQSIPSTSIAIRSFIVARRFSSSSSSAAKQKNLDELFPRNDRSKSNDVGDLKYRLKVAVIVERFPLIAPAPTDLEIRYKKMLRSIEDEQSLLSYHELRKEDERRAAKKGKPAITNDDQQIITAQDFEDASIEERKRFVPAARSYGEDENVQSLNRLLDRKLIFLIPSSYEASFWDVPQTDLRRGETLSQAAQRCLVECMNVMPTINLYGNAPGKFYKFKYPKPIVAKLGAIGEKVFMFKAELPRQSKFNPLVKDYRWLNREELQTAIKDKRYRQTISSFIFE